MPRTLVWARRKKKGADGASRRVQRMLEEEEEVDWDLIQREEKEAKVPVCVVRNLNDSLIMLCMVCMALNFITLCLV